MCYKSTRFKLYLSQREKSMETKRKTIFIYNFKRVLSLTTLSFFLIFSPMYASSQTENDRSSTRLEDILENTPNFILDILRAKNITTIDQLTSKTDKELLEIPNFGEISLRDLKKEMESKGYSLSSTPSTPLTPPVDSNLIEDKLFTEGRTVVQKLILLYLRKAEITTVDQLESKVPEQLLKIPNFGEISLGALIEEMESKGYSLSKDLRDIFFKEGRRRTSLQSKILNVLRWANITTMDQLTSKTEEEISKLIGGRGLTEIKTELEKNGKSLSSSSSIPSNLIEDIFFTEEGSRTAIQKKIMNALRSEDITTIDQLMEMSEEQILKVHDLGEASVKALQAEMEKWKSKCNKSFESISKK